MSTMQVISMYRYAIKGLSGDPIAAPSLTSSNSSPLFLKPGETFPDDRRFALIKAPKKGDFDAEDPKWLHKENFLCAFTAPALMATFDTEYRIVPNDDSDGEGKKKKRELTIWNRNHQNPRSEHLLGPLDLSSPNDCETISSFFSSACGEPVELVSKASLEHTHQFGNTRSGVKARYDTRTVHIVNAATIRQVSEKIGISLDPRRFRPNIVVDGWEPWQEFEAVGKSIKCYNPDDEEDSSNGLVFDVISKTVRCEGISIDPYDKEENQVPLDVPQLLQKHFPEHGPYLGVYAVVREGGSLCEGTCLKVIETDEINK